MLKAGIVELWQRLVMTRDGTGRSALWLTQVVAAIVLAASIGCGDGRARVHGKITLDGESAEGGFIQFIPMGDTKGGIAGAAIARGRYEITGANLPLPGTYRVEVRVPKKTGRVISLGSPAPKGTTGEEVIEAIPAKYNKDSTLQRELVAGANVVDFDLATSDK